MRKKKQKRSTVKARLWTLVSKYIRTKYMDDNGYIVCVTCGTAKLFSEIDAGHFIPKSKGLSIYFVEENIHPQCPNCNRFLEGNTAPYYQYMEEMYGKSKINELIALSNTIVKLTTNDLLDLEKEYKELLSNL